MRPALARAWLTAAAFALASCGGGTSLESGPAVPQSAQAEVPQAELEASSLMDWAEREFAQHFPSHQPNLSSPPYTYRAYPNGNYLGLAGDSVYIMGPVAGGNAPVLVGSIVNFICRATPLNCAASGAAVTGTVMGKGTALAAATVTLRDIAGATRSTTTSASGTYTLDVSGLAPPFVLTASGRDGRGVSTSLVSMGRASTGSQRVNLTPWTTALSAMVSPTGRATDLDATRDRTRIAGTLSTVITYSRTLLAPSLADAGASSADYDPIATLLTANGTGMAALYANLTVGVTPGTNAVFMANANASPCSPAQLGGCVRYSNPATQSTTNPNICGSDIATGASILCDASLPATGTPTPITINASQAYQFGCLGCVFWGPADDYTRVPTQTAVRVTTVTVAVTPVTPGTSTWYAHFSAVACAAGFCVPGAATAPVTSYNAQADCLSAGAIVNQALQAAAIAGLTWSYTCTQTP